MTAGIALRDVSVALSGNPVLSDLSALLPAGRITAILGRSGCGKSTMLRVIANLIRPVSGSLVFEEENRCEVQLAPGRLAYVFQDAALLPWRSVISNTTLPMELLNRYDKTERLERAAALLQSVGLDSDQWKKFPSELSGGMKMRVSIARALVTDPAVLLLDEPFAALDDMLRGRLGELVIQLWEASPRTIVLVTHNIAEAVLLSHQILVMGSGTIADEIATDLPHVPGVDVRTTPRFMDLYAKVTTSLRGAVEPTQ